MHFSPVKEGMVFFPKENKGYHYNTFIMTCFYAFAEARLLKRTIQDEHEYVAGAWKECDVIDTCLDGMEDDECDVIDTCLSAMEDGELNVLSRNQDEYYFWEWFPLTPRQWERICAVLRRQGIASSLLWTPLRVRLPYCKNTGLRAGIEYLWEDLDGIEELVLSRHKGYDCSECKWLKGELERRRRSWATGLRRAWLVAVTAG